MKETFLDLIICSNCEANTLRIQDVGITDKMNYEIREGMIQCENCNTHFPVQHGILDLLFDSHLRDNYYPRKGTSISDTGGGCKKLSILLLTLLTGKAIG